MPIDILRGPAGAGKSQWLEENRDDRLVLDLTRLWAALGLYTRGADGLYPVRRSDDPALTLARILKAAAIGIAAREGIDAIVTTSDSSAEEIERLRRRGAIGAVITIDPGLAEVRRRLADDVTGVVSDDCENAIQRWYNR